LFLRMLKGIRQPRDVVRTAEQPLMATRCAAALFLSCVPMLRGDTISLLIITVILQEMHNKNIAYNG
jgi:hypothetical protein